MKNLIVVLLTFSFYSAHSQLGSYVFGGNENDFIYEMVPTADGNFYAIGSKTIGKYRIWLMKIDPGGQLIWEKVLTPEDENKAERGFSFNVFVNGTIILTGDQYVDDPAQSKGLAIRIDQDGNIIWRKVYDNSNAFYDAVPEGAGILLGGWYDNPGSANSGLLVFTDNNGKELSRREVKVHEQTYIKKILLQPNSNRILVGRTNVSGNGFEGFFVKAIDGDLIDIWTTTYATEFREGNTGDFKDPLPPPMAAFKHDDGTFWIANPSGMSIDAEVFHLDVDGTLIEKREYGLSQTWEFPFSITPLDSNGLLIAGSTQNEKVFALKIKDGGIEDRLEFHEMKNLDVTSYGAVVTDDHFLLYGSMQRDSVTESNYDGWILALNKNGNENPYTITGRVVFDENRNCQYDAGELPISNWFLNLQGPGVQDTFSADKDGRFHFTTTNGRYSIRLYNQDESLWNICQHVLEAETNLLQTKDSVIFFVQAKDDCPKASVYLTQPDFIACDTSCMLVSVNNDASVETNAMLLSIVSDPELTLVSASEPFTTQNDKSIFQVDPISIFQHHTIDVCFVLDCDVQLGATHTVKALLEPLFCVPDYHGPFFTVEGGCVGNKVEVFLENKGGGGEQVYTEYSIFADGVIMQENKLIQLSEGEGAKKIVLPADGRTWHISIRQANGVPNREDQTLTIQGCGLFRNGLHDVNFANAYPVVDKASEVCVIKASNTIGAPNKISESVLGFGLYNLLREVGTQEFSARARNELNEIVHEVTFQLDFSPTFDATTFKLLVYKGVARIEWLGGGFIQIKLTGIDLFPGESCMIRFSCKAVTGIPPNSGSASLLVVYGNVFFNGHGPFVLSPGFNNYSFSAPVAGDPFLDYPPGINLYGGRYTDFGHCLAEGLNGDMFIAGSSNSFSLRENRDALIIKTTSYGRVIWQKAIDTELNGMNNVWGMAVLQDGGCIFVGDYLSPGTEYYVHESRCYMVRLDQSGNVVWMKSIPIPADSTGMVCNGLLETHDGNYLLFGATSRTVDGIVGSSDQYYMKVNPNGEILWQNFVNITGSAYSPGKGVTLADGSFVFLGPNNGIAFSGSFLEKIDSQGNILWTEEIETEHDSYLSDVAEMEDGNLLVIGSSIWKLDDTTYVRTPTFIKLSSEGEPAWERNPIIGPYQSADVSVIKRLPGDTFIIGGDIFMDEHEHTRDMLAMKINDEGEILWYRNFGNRHYELCYGVQAHSSGDFFLIGNNQQLPPYYNLDMMVVKVSDEGGLVHLDHSITEEKEYSTFLYPNPAEHEVNVLLSPPPVRKLNWVLYNVTGQFIQAGFWNPEEIGMLELSTMDSGIYFLSFPGSLYPITKIIKI